MQENTKQVIVKMTARRCFRTEPIYQYDVGHVLSFDGFELPASFEVHFSRSPMGNAIPQIGTNGVCAVPDMYTQSAGVIYAWLYIADTETGLTKYSIEIPVQKRAKPTDQQPTPVEQSAIDQAIAALNAGVEAAEDAQEAAEAAQASAESYAESAGQSAITATNAATSAAASAGNAAASATSAGTSATDANASRQAADLSATNAGVSERNAAASATAAAGSATSAAASASQASGSATAASGSASTASARAGEAAQSATAAAGSAASASEDAGTASTAATAAGASATAAAGSATAAAGSATSAGQSATAAAGSAQTAQDVLDSIPADYSELSDDVDSLKSAFDSISGASINIFDKDSVELKPNALLDDSGVESSSSTSGYTLSYIAVEPSTQYRFTPFATQSGGNCRIYYYTSGKTWISRSAGQSQYRGFVITTPANCAFIRIQYVMATVNWDLCQITEGEEEYPYFPYLTAYDSLARVKSSEAIESVEALEDKLKDEFPLIVLPTDLYMVAGTEVNIYTDNVLLGNYEKYAIDWAINSATWANQLSECMRLTPTNANVGNYTINFRIRDKKTFDILESRTISLHVLATPAIANKKMLFIGDSLTAAGYFAYELQHNLSNGGIVSVGTITAQPWFEQHQVDVSVEGRGGWSASDYVTKASKGGVSNAFWNSNTDGFDFEYYLSNTGISVPDIIFLALGTNGVNNADDEVAALSEMISSIRTVSSTVPIVVTLITPPATQDGWTTSSHGGSVDIFKRLQLLLNQRYLNEYQGKMANVYVVPLYFNIDRNHDFSFAMEAVSSRNPYEVYRQTNNVHPSSYGYLKMADIYWGIICDLLT